VRRSAGDYPGTTRFAELLFGHCGAWSYVKTFGAPVDVDARDLPIDLASGPSEILKTADGIRVSTVATHHGDAPAELYTRHSRKDAKDRKLTEEHKAHKDRVFYRR
jgi:hypothetical protein